MFRKSIPLLLMFTLMFSIFACPAFADIGTDLKKLQEGVLKLSIPIGAVILIFAGIMMAQGKPEAVKSALIGLAFIFASNGIVIFISSIFGN